MSVRGAERSEFEGRLIRYGDDFVLLTRHRPDRELAWLQALMARMGLALHPDKTRVVDARKERFDFLGYRVGWRRKQLLLDISPKSRARIHERLRQTTKWTFLHLDDLVAKLNRYIGGARAVPLSEAVVATQRIEAAAWSLVSERQRRRTGITRLACALR